MGRPSTWPTATTRESVPTTETWQTYKSAGRMDLYRICRAFGTGPKRDCIRRCLLDLFDTASGRYLDPGPTTGYPGMDAIARPFFRRYGPDVHGYCFGECIR